MTEKDGRFPPPAWRRRSCRPKVPDRNPPSRRGTDTASLAGAQAELQARWFSTLQQPLGPGAETTC